MQNSFVLLHIVRTNRQSVSVALVYLLPSIEKSKCSQYFPILYKMEEARHGGFVGVGIGEGIDE